MSHDSYSVELQDLALEEKTKGQKSEKDKKAGRRESRSEIRERQTLEFNEDKFFGQTRITDSDDKSAPKDGEDLIVEMKNVHKTYLLGVEGVPALRGVTVNIKKGEFVVVFGTSGGGKTTLLNICGTIDKPTKGELKLCGVRINDRTKDSDLSNLRLNKVGFVFQTFNLLSALTAQENVEMPMILNGSLTAAERKQRAIELLDMVGLKHRLDHVPSQMSGGEQQRTTIARAIANNPELLLLDEPTGDLDTVNTLIAMKLLTKLNKEEKITMLMVTHDVALKSFADRVIWMRDGKIQRIEVMPSWKKEEAIAKLDAQLKEVQRKRKEKAKLKKERQKAKKKGEKGAKDELRLPTEVRMPTDYETHPRFAQRDVEFTETRPDILKRQEKKKQKKANHSKDSETSSTRTRSDKGKDSGSESEEENSQEKDSIDIVIEKEERAQKAGKKEKKDNKKKSQKSQQESDEESEDESDQDEEDTRDATSKYTFRED
jgi:putative ABC transport system ATP-binding protein